MGVTARCDPACADPARILRLPESWHAAADRQVAVIDGNGERYAFDELADTIWRVSGRPGRAAMTRRREARARGPERSKGIDKRSAPRGLSRPRFWPAVRGDLETLGRRPPLPSRSGAAP